MHLFRFASQTGADGCSRLILIRLGGMQGDDEMNREQLANVFVGRLVGMRKDKLVAFSLRVSLRALPLMMWYSEQGNTSFGYWEEEKRAGYLLAIIHAQVVGGLLFSRRPEQRDTATAITAANVAAAAANAAFATAFAAAYAAADVAYAVADNSHDYGKAIYAANSAAAAIAIMPAIQHQFDIDISILHSNSGAKLLEMPLWYPDAPVKKRAYPATDQSDTNLALWQKRVGNFMRDASALDPGLQIWLDWYADRVAGKPFDLATMLVLADIPQEKLVQGPEAVQAWVRSVLHAPTPQPLNRVRSIFIGHGAVGKTSLVRVLHHEAVLAGIEPMTPGIDIREWAGAGNGIKTDFWDFGGQVIAHATHQFFLRAQCVYVLVLEARHSHSPNEDAEYWLQHVRAFGGDAPVLLVGNKHDQTPVDLQMHTLRCKYPNIVDFFPMSCTLARTQYLAETMRFENAFCQQIKQIAGRQKLFTQPEFAVLALLRERAKNHAFLPYAEFDRLCQQNAVIDDGPKKTRTWFLGMLDSLGVVIHFPQLPYLRDYVLNPQWLTFGVYKLIFCQQPELTDQDIIRILGSKVDGHEYTNQLTYEGDKCRLIADAMEQFKLAFRLKAENNKLIIPSLLSAELPGGMQLRDFDDEATLAYKLKFDAFVPRHILPELIVVRNEEIENRQMCQKAVILRAPGGHACAMLEVDYPARQLLVLIKGAKAREYLDGLRQDVLRILARLDLEHDELIRLPASAMISDSLGMPGRRFGDADWARFLQVENHRKRGKAEFISDKGEYDVSRLIDLYGSPRHAGGVNVYGNVEKVILGNDKQQTFIDSTIAGPVLAVDRVDGSF